MNAAPRKEPKNPEALDSVNALKVTNELTEFVTGLSKQIDEGRNLRMAWEQRLDDWFRKRYGVRARKTHPWLDAANFVIPLIDSDINRVKPAYVNLAYAVTPMVTFEPYGPEDVEAARKREWLFDWRMRTQVDFFEPYVVGIDKMLEKGVVVFKVVWDFKTRTYGEVYDLDEMDPEERTLLLSGRMNFMQIYNVLYDEFRPDLEFEANEMELRKAVVAIREGKARVEMNFTEKYKDCVRVIACDPKEDLVVPVETCDLQKARYIDYKYWISPNELKIEMNDGKFVEHEDSDIESWGSRDATTRWNISNRDGTSMYGDSELILMHETCAWYDTNGDGIDEKVIITWPDADPGAILRFIENPYDHGEFPYVAVKRELVDYLFYGSRGIPALDDDFQTGISTKFNQDIDNQTIVNTPTVVARRNAVKNLTNLRYVPGQVIECDNPATDYELRQQQNFSQNTFLTSAQYLKGWANERLGNFTSGLSSPLNLRGQGLQGQKTKREIDVVSQLSTEIQSLDLQVFQQQMAKVYYQIDALYEQFGSDSEQITNVNGERVKISRRDIQGKFKIVPNGKLDNSNVNTRIQKSYNAYRLFAGDPDIKQRELKKMVLDDMDSRWAGKLLLSEEEILQRDQQTIQQQMGMREDQIQTGARTRSISDAMDVRKEAILAKIQGRKYAPDSSGSGNPKKETSASSRN